MREIIYICLFWIICITMSVNAQTNSEYPLNIQLASQKNVDFLPVMQHVNLPRLSMGVYQRQYTGIFKDIYQGVYSGQYSIKNSLIGIMAYTDRQGDLLKRNRMYLKYSLSVEIDKSRYVFIGISAGVVNKSIGGDNTKLKASATAFDASVGVGYYSTRYNAIIALNQIPQTIIQPLNNYIILKRYFSFYGSGYLYNSSELKYKMILSGDLYALDNKSIWLSNEFYYRDIGYAGIALENNSKTLFSLGINVWKKDKDVLALQMAYETSSGLIRNFGYIVNTVQFGLNFRKN